MTWRNELLIQQLKECKVLVIGAGGIGCELLKNLALTGFKNITVIDLDTIDISNLNRQFLFRKEHVGKSKAEVAAASVLQLAPDVEIKYHHDSIMSEKFGVDFFKSFDFVMSALDNKAARSHVNRLCLVAGIPLIESGSAGYLGQVGVILKGKTECYDCVPKANQKTYPSCTIRNTPSEPIHCVVWSKSLFNQLFGEEDPDEDVAPDATDNDSNVPIPNGAQGNGTIDMDQQALNVQQIEIDGNVPKMDDQNPVPDLEKEQPKRLNTRQFAQKHNYDPKMLFEKLFYEDINYLISMAHLWKDRKKPSPKHFDDVVSGGLGSSKKLNASDVWSLSKWAETFEDSINELYHRFQEVQQKNGVLSWDKDDDAAMNFVAACTNIRANIFHIAGKSLFDIKAMAGNIIPAIATTNACVAGMILVEALKIVQGQLDKCRWVYIKQQPNPRGKILVDEKPCAPKPNCYVCSAKREVIVRVNLAEMTVGRLRDKVLVNALNMLQPDVTDLFTNRIILSSEEGETDERILGSTLKSLGVQNGAQLECDDFTQKLDFKLLIFHSDALNLDEYELGSEAVPPATEGAEEENIEAKAPKRPATQPVDGLAEQESKRSKIE